MVKFNATGLHAFYNLLKNLSVTMLKFGKEWLVWIVEQTILRSK
jgi:hypothetical protein